jgi:hypothetical protein
LLTGEFFSPREERRGNGKQKSVQREQGENKTEDYGKKRTRDGKKKRTGNGKSKKGKERSHAKKNPPINSLTHSSNNF